MSLRVLEGALHCGVQGRASPSKNRRRDRESRTGLGVVTRGEGRVPGMIHAASPPRDNLSSWQHVCWAVLPTVLRLVQCVLSPSQSEPTFSVLQLDPFNAAAIRHHTC